MTITSEVIPEIVGESVFWFLLKAHDSLATNKGWPLSVRRDGCAILWKLAHGSKPGARMNL